MMFVVYIYKRADLRYLYTVITMTVVEFIVITNITQFVQKKLFAC